MTSPCFWWPEQARPLAVKINPIKKLNPSFFIILITVFFRGPLRAPPTGPRLLDSIDSFCSRTDGLKLATSEEVALPRLISFPEAISSRGDLRSVDSTSSSPASCDVVDVDGGGGVSSSVDTGEAFFNAIEVRVLRTISGGKHYPTKEKLEVLRVEVTNVANLRFFTAKIGIITRNLAEHCVQSQMAAIVFQALTPLLLSKQVKHAATNTSVHTTERMRIAENAGRMHQNKAEGRYPLVKMCAGSGLSILQNF